MATSRPAKAPDDAGPGIWAARLQTLRAIMLILRAQLLVRFVPLAKWHGSLGKVIEGDANIEIAASSFGLAVSRAARVKRAAARMPAEPKCLAQAMALQWMLVREGFPSRLVVARHRDEMAVQHAYHAWVELDGQSLTGTLPTELGMLREMFKLR